VDQNSVAFPDTTDTGADRLDPAGNLMAEGEWPAAVDLWGVAEEAVRVTKAGTGYLDEHLPGTRIWNRYLGEHQAALFLDADRPHQPRRSFAHGISHRPQDYMHAH
jgi:hypothetical protein